MDNYCDLILNKIVNDLKGMPYENRKNYKLKFSIQEISNQINFLCQLMRDIEKRYAIYLETRVDKYGDIICSVLHCSKEIEEQDQSE